ncbi:MAG: hypothetical protein K8S94_13715 [Planctomycetia bacterium]|nr:hypothetical protein [Planctomycetia bacterium]
MNPLIRCFVPVVVSVAIVAVAGSARACPFCSAVSLTFAQEIAQSQAAVIAKLVEPPPAGALSPRAEGPLPKGKFEVVEVLKGADLVAEAGLTGGDPQPIETIMLEEKPVGMLFLLMGVEPPDLVWSSPVRVSDRAVAYIRKLGELPEKGPERLAFFQEHLEDEDETLARDAYDEFAIAPYADVRSIKEQMHPAKLLAWIEDPKVQANRRRLYATMLGVCGSKDDAERIEKLLAGTGLSPEQAEARSGLDALIACYVALEGPQALDLVDRLFLDRTSADGMPREVPFTETYAAVMALRFLGEESDLVPRDRVLASLRLLLEEPKLADLVIADLARWQDWSAVDTLVTLFKEAKADNIFVREPIVNYLRACPLPEAAAAVKELETIDPEAVRRAATLAGIAGLTASGTTAATPSGDEDDNAGPRGPNEPITAPAEGSPGSLAVAPVLGDDDATDDVPGRDASQPERETAATVSRRWKWLLWAAVVLAIAIVSRAAMRPVPAGDR